MEEGINVTIKVMPRIPATDAICIKGKQLIWEYAMLAAVPSGANFISKYSNVEKNKGKARREYHAFNFNAVDLLRIMIPAKINAGANVKIIAGKIVATLTKYQNQLSLPIKYVINEARKATLPEFTIARQIIGIGAIHTRYQKSPFNPFPK
jgi:hypothetical protein